MSPIGRIFIVLNLVLAAAFLGWASNAVASNQDWKAKHDALSVAKDLEIGTLEKTLGGVREELRQKTDEAADKRSDSVREKGRADRAEESLAREVERNGRLETQLGEIEAKIGTIDKTLAQVESDRDAAVQASIEAKSQADKALRDQQTAENAQRTAEERFAVAQREIADHERDAVAKQAQIDELSTDLAKLQDYTNVSLSEITSPPFIEGKVLAYNSELGGLVTLNVGRTSGVKRGFTFEIYAGAQYKGRVRVQDVVENMCSALVVMPVEGGMIGVGDAASTRL